MKAANRFPEIEQCEYNALYRLNVLNLVMLINIQGEKWHTYVTYDVFLLTLRKKSKLYV